MKKYISYTTLGLVGVATLMALLGIFGVPVFKGVGLQILFTVVTLAVVALLLLNTAELIERKNVVAYISLGLLALSAVLFLIIIWGKLFVVDTFGRITVTISMVSVVFNIITANALKLGKRYLVVQLIEYALLAVIVVLITITIFDGKFARLGSAYFWASVVVAFAMGIAVSVFAKKVASEGYAASKVKEGYIQVSKEEYDKLVAENQELKKKLAELENK